MRRKKVPVSYIYDGYIDGTCIKDERLKYKGDNDFVKFFCGEKGIITYWYRDKNYTEEILVEILFESRYEKVDIGNRYHEYMKYFCEFKWTWNWIK